MVSDQARQAAEAVSAPISPWFGLAVIAILLISGGLAIVREIQIEERERRQDDA